MLMTLEALTENLCAALGSVGQVIGPDRNAIPRFSLFHAANSICSQKVRVVLAHHQISYASHAMSIFGGQTYLPSYVQLRLVGCERSGLPLVSAHTGSSSTSAGGCDPAVVPTLIDRRTAEVVVDSKRICLYVDSIVSNSQRLRPTLLEESIDAELDVVDNLPNYQMLVGRPAGADLRPQRLQENDGVKFAMSKVRRCDQYLADYAADKSLVNAYQAKRAKELDAARNLFSPEAVRVAHVKANAACAQLNRTLETCDTTWLLGNAVTMADLFWAVELLRMKNLGAGHIWEQNKLPAVERFLAAAERLESVRSSVLEWPGSLL
jgi:2,5-dichlorohydroquinone reductive dechlorinase